MPDPGRGQGRDTTEIQPTVKGDERVWKLPSPGAELIRAQGRAQVEDKGGTEKEAKSVTGGQSS
jgi:hypothetical protein